VERFCPDAYIAAERQLSHPYRRAGLAALNGTTKFEGLLARVEQATQICKRDKVS